MAKCKRSHWELNANYFSTLMRGLADAQNALVFALAEDTTREFDEGYRFRHWLPASSTVHSALKELINDGIVEDGESAYRLDDPMFVRFVRTSPGKMY